MPHRPPSLPPATGSCSLVRQLGSAHTPPCALHGLRAKDSQPSWWEAQACSPVGTTLGVWTLPQRIWMKPESRGGGRAHLADTVDPVEIGRDLGVHSRGARAPTAVAPAHDAHDVPLAGVMHQGSSAVSLGEGRAGAAG